MKSAIRIGVTNTRLASQIAPRSGFVCLQCRQRASQLDRWPQSTPSTTYTVRRHASNEFLEGLRKRIWGTSNPPGREDPYGDKSLLYRTKERGKDGDAAEAAPEAELSGTTPTNSQLRGRELGPDYVPAISIADLATLPPLQEVYPFKGFMASSKLKTQKQISAAVRRALIEIYTLQEAMMPLVLTTSREDDLPELNGISFSHDIDGNVTLKFAEEGLREKVIESTSRVEIEEETSYSEEDKLKEMEQQLEHANNNTDAGIVEPDSLPTSDVEVEPLLEESEASPLDAASKDHSWRNITLDDPDIKFAVLKRVMQLTGSRIPDPEIDGIKSANGILGHLIKKPKPKKLAETLKLSDKLKILPNLQIMDRRYTPIDKEKELGRWKVAVKELRARGLPVTGHA